MCQTMWRCPDCGGRMLAREQWAHQCGEEVNGMEQAIEKAADQ